MIKLLLIGLIGSFLVNYGPVLLGSTGGKGKWFYISGLIIGMILALAFTNKTPQ